MAKCWKCGKGGLFRKMDKDGLCKECAQIVAQTGEITRLERKIRELRETCASQEALTEKAVEEAKTEAHKRLEADFAQMSEKYDFISKSYYNTSNQLDQLREQVAQLEKKKSTVESKVETANRALKYIKYALDLFPQDHDRSEMESRLRSIDAVVHIETASINCLTMKDLRRQYRQIERQISDLYATYSGRYTTKANAAIYRLMVMALEAELQIILKGLAFGKLEDAVEQVKDITARYYKIATDGNQTIAPTLKKFIGSLEYLYIEAVKTEYEYYVRRERAKEEQRAIKEQMRQEAEERKRLEQERRKVEAEEQKYRQEIDRITEQMQKAHDAEMETLRKRLAEVTALVDQVEEKKADIINLQNGKAGTVYIISNVGSFGDNVFKVGMTRRLEPQERVNELGDASVPFPFDVHSFIFSEDAVSLESALHRELNARRVNKVNLRKEFFNVSAEELQSIVERIDPTAPFRLTALAEQYRQSQSMESVPDDVEALDMDDEAS